MKKRRISIQILTMLMIAFCFFITGVKSEAISISSGFTNLTKYDGTEDGYSYPGIKVYVDNIIKAYAFDTWKKEAGSWNYNSSNINGKTLTSNTNVDIANNIIMPFASASSSRFILKAKQIDGVATNFSVVLSKYLKGTMVQTQVEYSDDIHSQASMGALSFCSAYLNNHAANCSTYGADTPSYVFQVYNAKNIIPGSNEFCAEVNGGSLVSAGHVCYDGSMYSIRKLPEVHRTREGYNVAFDGWYNSNVGGKKYEVGDLVTLGSKFYARWVETPNEYKVNCIDIVSEADSGETLGNKVWNAAYGVEVSGSDIGSDQKDSVYYKGYTYSGCTNAIVTTSGATIYRYFEKSRYNVHYIDKVISGKEKGKILNDYQTVKRYLDVVDGMDQGTDTSEGAYYMGYMAASSTADTVIGEGTSVYRYFEPVMYNIHFEGNENTSGTMRDIIDCEYLSNITLPNNLFQKEIKLKLNLNCEDAVCDSSVYIAQARFKGWSRSRDGNAEYTDGSSICELAKYHREEITLYAVWDYGEQNITCVPKRLGYQFGGWSMNAEDVIGNVRFSLKEDTELYAVWKPDVVKYNVEYYKEKLDGSYELAAQYQFGGYTGKEVSITSNADIYQGYTLDQAASILKGTVKGDGSLVLSAYYSRNIYKVTFDTNNGVSEDQIDETLVKNKYGAEYTIPNYTASRYGYRFAGWSMEKDNYHRIYEGGDTFVIQNHDVVLYAAWLPTSYEVTFEANIPSNCKDPYTQAMEKQKISFDSEALLSECRYRAPGYSFEGWCKKSDGSSKIYHKEDTVRNLTTDEYGKVTLYAIWKPLRYTIKYDVGNVPAGLEAKGQVLDTSYQFDQDSFVTTQRFKAVGYHLKYWNTKKDGTGIALQPGENLKEKYLGENDITLYAIWEADEDTVFEVELRKGNQEESVELERLTLCGTTGQKVANALEEIYNDTLCGEGAAYFYRGYEVQNKEALQEKILGDSSLYLVLYVKERDCTITYYQMENDRDAVVSKDIYMYQENVKLPGVVGDAQNVGRFVDQDGKIYMPGQTISITFNLKLYIQHVVYFHGINATKEYVTSGKRITLPDALRKGYQLEGWYEDVKLQKLAGKAGQKSDSIYTTKHFFAKWSEPQKYTITYDIDSSQVSILENKVTEYTFGQKTILPDASQIALLEGYTFVGWYYADDLAHNIITSIEANETGDKVLRILIVRQEHSDIVDTEPDDVPLYFDNQGNALPSADSSNNKDSMQKKDSLTQSTQNMKSGNSNGKKTFTKKGITYELNGNNKEICIKKIVAKKNKLVILGKIKYQNQTYTVTRIAGKAMCNNEKIKELILPDTVVQIGDRAFYKNARLEKVTLGKKIRVIRKGAFAKSNRLSKIIAKGVGIKKIGKGMVSNRKKAIIVMGRANKKKAYLKLLKRSDSKIRWAYKKL